MDDTLRNTRAGKEGEREEDREQRHETPRETESPLMVKKRGMEIKKA